MARKAKKKKYSKYIVEGCAGCAKIDGGVCKVIMHPEYFFDNYGGCFARTEDSKWEEKVAAEVEVYQNGHSWYGGDSNR